MNIAGGMIDNRQMLEMSFGDTLVWPTTKPVVQIQLGLAPFQMANQMRTAIYAAGEHYSTVEVLPFRVELVGSGSVGGLFNGCSNLTTAPDMDTSNVTNTQSMFSSCTSLTSVPSMDTSNVINMQSMFFNCVSLITTPEMDTVNVTNMSSMFQGCNNLATVPDMDTVNATNMSNMFMDCQALYDGSVRLLRDTMPPPTATTNMIYFSGLTRLPFYNYDGTPLN